MSVLRDAPLALLRTRPRLAAKLWKDKLRLWIAASPRAQTPGVLAITTRAGFASAPPPAEQPDTDRLLQFKHQDQADRGERGDAHVGPIDRPRVVEGFERRQIGEQDLQHDDGADADQERAGQPDVAKVERRAMPEPHAEEVSDFEPDHRVDGESLRALKLFAAMK